MIGIRNGCGKVVLPAAVLVHGGMAGSAHWIIRVHRETAEANSPSIFADGDLKTLVKPPFGLWFMAKCPAANLTAKHQGITSRNSIELFKGHLKKLIEKDCVHHNFTGGLNVRFGCSSQIVQKGAFYKDLFWLLII
ncbi:MAG: hypothetical protein Q8P24_14130 [Desulfobacterales bacterium]|nr:hypothetical protein [Desulfobacterales bacterium]